MMRATIDGRSGHRVWALGLVVAALVAFGLMLTAKPAHASTTFTVNNTVDPGNGVCAANGCTLREAITAANATPGADTIDFNILGQGVKTIFPSSELPEITEAVTIDGYSQPGSSPNTLTTGTNALIMIELDGSLASVGSGLEIRADDVVVRGLAVGRFSLHGIQINSLPGGAGEPSGVRIAGNFVGTDASGTQDRGNGSNGLDLTASEGNNIMGGTSSATRNLISGNGGHGVGIIAPQGGYTVAGNLIGTQKDGTTSLGNADNGVHIANADLGNTIGGTIPAAANTIAFNGEDGVGVGFSTERNRIVGNSIFSNADLGIDLTIGAEDDGPTPNDPRDTDSGPNTRQNFPDLASAKKLSGTTTVKGTLDSTPSTKRKKMAFTIQFFANPQNDPFSFGEGKTLLGQKKVTTNRQGLVSFSFETNKPLALGDRITATATGPGGNTSEFSDPASVEGAPQPK